MLPERGEEPGGDATPVGASVEREILPGVPIPLLATRREVGRVRENQVEPAQARCQVGAYGIERKLLAPGPSNDGAQRGRIQVGGDHPACPVPCCNEGRQPSAASHLEDGVASAWSSEASEEPGVLAHGVDLGELSRA
ncbi:MAG: hypothetical protein WCB19_06685, partial [Thermoplasmata archaeon]